MIHHYEKDSIIQARKFLAKFERQVEKRSMERFISASAKEQLTKRVKQLIEQLS